MISDTGIWTIIISLIAVAFAVQYSRSETFGGALLWLVWDFTGLRFIATKVFPIRKGSTTPPVTITLWVIGIYTALFGIASNRYENAVDKIENRMNAFITQLAVVKDSIRREGFGEIREIQQMGCPVYPSLLEPSTVFLSLIKVDIYDEAVTVLTRTLEKNKNYLKGALLDYTRLEGASLGRADLEGAHLMAANLDGADLGGANLKRARLWGTSLVGANLRDANLEGADLAGAKLKDVSFFNASFVGAQLRGVEGLDLKELCFVKSFYRADMGFFYTRHVKSECPEKLEKPDWLD